MQEWRDRNYQGATRVTRELIDLWRAPDRAEPLFYAQIEAAEDDLTKTQPGLFLPNGDVKDKFEYISALAKRLTQMTGICSEPLGHDEIRTKDNQSVSQHVDVLIADQTPWVGGAYTCRPASF